MPRTSGAIVQNNFVGGLKTEFTGLNFPENAATDADNCIFSRIGRVTRRKGFDQEDQGVYTDLNRSGSVVSSYVWKDVAGDGNITLLVMQIGNLLRFYEASDVSTAPSAQLLATTVTLSTFTPVGSVISPITDECQFAQGDGFLFVFHPNLEPFFISYNPITQTVTATAIIVQIRDLEGIAEGISDSQRPTTITDSHRYNLGNQGWRSGYLMTSTTSVVIGTGAKSFTTNLSSSQTPVIVGDFIKIYQTSNHSNFMTGWVTSFASTTLNVTINSVGGSGTFTDWSIGTNPNDILTWNDALGNFPSNADVWWHFKNSSDVFAPSTTILNVPISNTRAPKGHYIVDAFNINRSAISGVPNLTTVTTGGIRPHTGAFFQGRVFYSGVNATTYNSNIYFSQTIESTEQFGRCFQLNDLTSEEVFDLLPTDGGVISIQGVGQILKLVALKTALVVFASNGIWAITGSQGLGFTANDYTVVPISNLRALSFTSFVVVQETITWWNNDGIHALKADAQGLQIQSLTQDTISQFYADIPDTAKANARGFYNPVSFIIQWLYRSTPANTIEERYEFDRILNFNTVTSAFYPWSISDSDVKVNGIMVLDTPGGVLQINNVVRGVDNVVDGSGNQVVTYSFSDNVTSLFKYIISKPSGSTYLVSLGEEFKTEYVDWLSEGGLGVDYESFFVTGFAVHGDAQRFFQSNYVYVYSDSHETELNPASYTIQGIFNYANTPSSGKYSSIQRVTTTHGFFDVIKKRFKIRGRGLAIQLKFGSTGGLPLSIIGWSKLESANAGI